MGRDCAATSSLVYGITVKVPESPCWPLFLKRLKRVAVSDDSLAAMAARAVPAESLKKGDDDDPHDGTKLPEPIAKYARATKCILVSCDEAETEQGEDVNQDEPWDDDGDEIAVINYLKQHEKEIPKAAKVALDKALGPGHGLWMKIYYGHDEDTSNVALLLQVKASSFSSGRIDSFQGVSMTKVDTTLKDKEKTDTLIKKALDVFGLEAKDGEQPGWIIATTCCCSP